MSALAPDVLTITQPVMVANPGSSFFGKIGHVTWRVDRTYGVRFGGPSIAFGRSELVIAPSGAGRKKALR